MALPIYSVVAVLLSICSVALHRWRPSPNSSSLPLTTIYYYFPYNRKCSLMCVLQGHLLSRRLLSVLWNSRVEFYMVVMLCRALGAAILSNNICTPPSIRSDMFIMVSFLSFDNIVLLTIKSLPNWDCSIMRK